MLKFVLHKLKKHQPHTKGCQLLLQKCKHLSISSLLMFLLQYIPLSYQLQCRTAVCLCHVPATCPLIPWHLLYTKGRNSMPEIENLVYYYYVYRVSTVSLSGINYCLVFRHTLDIRLRWKFINLVTILELLIAMKISHMQTPLKRGLWEMHTFPPYTTRIKNNAMANGVKTWSCYYSNNIKSNHVSISHYLCLKKSRNVINR